MSCVTGNGVAKEDMQAIESKLKVNRDRQAEKIKCKQQQSPQTQQVGPPAGNAVNEGAATSSVEQATSAPSLPTIEGLEKLLSSVNLEEKLPDATKWCRDEGAERVEDLMEEDYAEQLAKALQLPQIKSTRLIKAIKSCKSSQAVAPAAAQAPAAGAILKRLVYSAFGWIELDWGELKGIDEDWNGLG